MDYLTKMLERISKDKYQKKAYDTEDSTVVIAGPGSGKTTILTLKIMKLLNGHIHEPQGLACLTFSKEAAREFKERLEKLGYKKRVNVFLGTVHSFCVSEILGNFAELYDCGIPMPIKIVPDKLKKEIFEKAKENVGQNPNLKIEAMNKQRALQIPGSSNVKVADDVDAKTVAAEYEKILYKAGYIDFETIIIVSTRLIQEHEYVRECLNAKYPWLVIDEYQDLGKPLHEMVLALFNQTNIKLFVVGDPDQSIYKFAGAIPNYLMELYDRQDIIPVKLMNNYRSNQDIVDGSETVLNIKRDYHAATREGESAEYRFIDCDKGLEDQFDYFIKNIIPESKEKKIPLEEIAVLLGTRADCQALATECINNNVPHYISNHIFERTDFVKWLESCALWVNDRTAVSFDDIYDYWKTILLLKRENHYISEKENLTSRIALLEILEKSIHYKGSIKNWLEYMYDALRVNEVLKDAEQLPDEIDNLNELYNEVCDEKYTDYDTSKFSKLGKPENQITISTRHSSKGLEFEVVVLMGMEENNFPSWWVLNYGDEEDLEECNRMCFVCVSRAKRVCILMKSKKYVKNGKFGPYEKTFEASRYWKQLYQKYINRE
ncbi:MAG: ATP-dependent helicase [Lachnospiraceae bacterium]|nr:ATP-dependent helicase [Lachnospiraceae bacterium]